MAGGDTRYFCHFDDPNKLKKQKARHSVAGLPFLWVWVC
jgi:hypothetical protein